MGSITRNFANNILTAGKFDGTKLTGDIPQANLSANAPAFDDNKVVNDLATLGLRVHTQENLTKSNTNSQYVDTFQDATGYTNGANTTRNAGEFVSSVATVTSTSNAGGSDTNFGDGNLRWSSTGANRDIYGTGNDIGYDGTSYNYNQLSSSDGSASYDSINFSESKSFKYHNTSKCHFNDLYVVILALLLNSS